jgi:LysM repeat protein
MAYKPPYQEFKEKQDKRKKLIPWILGSISILLVGIGTTLIVIWVQGGSSFEISATDPPTPEPTNTAAPPTLTPTMTLIPTETGTPLPSATPTASAPFEYIVQSGDYISTIAEAFGIEDVLSILNLNNMTYSTILYPGDVILIPDPNYSTPTPTPLPDNLASGAIIEYEVLPGDTLQGIAFKFNSTESAIIEENDLDDPDTIYPGQILRIPVNIATPVPTATQVPAATEEPTATPEN